MAWLKIFELHSRQCGLLLYVGGELASVMLTPHPEDYRALHATLLNDLYGEVIYQYGMLSTVLAEPSVRLDAHGEIAYLKTFRLSVGQVKRGHLLSPLSENDWNLHTAGASIGATGAEIGSRLEASDFGHLLRPDILERFRRSVG